MWQVKEQVQQFRARESKLAEAEQQASTYEARESALAARQQSVSDLEDRAQRASAAAEYARKEADAMWQKQKVRHLWGCTICTTFIDSVQVAGGSVDCLVTALVQSNSKSINNS